jgi:DNA-binding PadR family transcriptional regulator
VIRERRNDMREHEHHHGSHGRGRRGQGRTPRGRVRGLILASLLDGPAHGYELMRRLQETAGGRWRPSPGSIYPMLQMFEDEGLIRGRDEDGRRVYELTDEGREQADGELLDKLKQAGEKSGGVDLRDEVRLLHLAAKQVGVAGSPEQIDQAGTIVREARQALYRLLTD